MAAIIDGLTWLSMTEAAKLVELSNDRFGRLLMKHMVPNGVRIFNTAKNNKGIKICKEDIQLVINFSIDNGIRIIDVLLIN